jgi:peptidoglycan/LPS O-acetylase OafA/YrhL
VGQGGGSRLTDLSPPVRRVAGLDGVRGAAILLVVAAHANIPVLRQAGAAGVAVFFVLSGYLITVILLERPRLTAFYARRAARLLPAFVLLLIVLGALALAVRPVGVGRSMLLALLYVSNWARVTGISQGVLGHTWTLSVEEQFYLLWPAIILLTPTRRIRSVMVLIILISLTVRLTVSSTHAYEGTDANAYAFALGGLVATLRSHSGRSRGIAWIGSALVILSAVWSVGAQEHVALLASIGAVLVVWTASAGNLPTPKVLRHLGAVSYGWYLWHYPLTRLAAIGTDNPLAPGIAILLALGLAELSFRFVEVPVSRWARGRWPYVGEAAGARADNSDLGVTVEVVSRDATKHPITAGGTR